MRHSERTPYQTAASQCWPAASAPGEIADEHVHVWRVDLIQPDATVTELERLLTDGERDRGRRFYFARDRRRFIVSRAALRHILSVSLLAPPPSIEISTGSYGKPKLIEGDLRFNVSHSGSLALIAVARNRELGIDVEELRLP